MAEASRLALFLQLSTDAADQVDRDHINRRNNGSLRGDRRAAMFNAGTKSKSSVRNRIGESI